ncbi:MAG TPA: hypothetical protein PLT45_02520 [Smithella sp.]|nr:hypothetical protein [Smithella sp.]
MKYYDQDSYRFHGDDAAGRCFCCRQSVSKLLIVRHVQSEKMVHLCSQCLVEHTDDYLLDNTRPWTGPFKK